MGDRLRGSARLLRVFVWIGIALLLLVPVARWYVPELTTGGALARESLAQLGGGHRFAGLALEYPPFLILALGLGQLLGFCRKLNGRVVFSQAAATALRNFGWSLIAAAIALPVSRTLLWFYIGAVSEGPSPGPFSVLMPGLLLPFAFGIVFGLVFVVFAAVLTEASAIADENASIL
jgi:Protein of unknown function (DUF2975)